MKLNKELLKNRNFQIGAVIVVVLILLGGFLLFKNSNSSTAPILATPAEAPILKLTANELGLTLMQDSSGQFATMKITNTSDLTSVDYQLTYNATVAGEQVQRGTIGHVDVKNPGQTVSQKMIFGTCSDVCHYDKDVTDVKLIVKVTKTDGKVYQSETGVTSE